jgi:hypothetical protein
MHTHVTENPICFVINFLYWYRLAKLLILYKQCGKWFFFGEKPSIAIWDQTGIQPSETLPGAFRVQIYEKAETPLLMAAVILAD